MRKRQHKQILDLLNTITKAQTAKLYGDCQEGALFLCDFIENIEGNDGAGAEAVALLIQYCELLFKASKGEVSEKLLKKHLLKTENIINHKMEPKRIEMAFISYKASMSDSLESIYLAAKDDPDVDAYWIPVPYDEIGLGGVVNGTVYEGAESYPDYIEVVDWQEYDIETRQPDVIFTFSPYDGDNLVTRIHQSFYCERLRRLTGMLVYIPYSVFSDVPQDIHCTTAGCIFAHKVILQNEKVRDTFIREFTNVFGDRLGNPKDKFVALGSPKYDKVINSRREDYVLPSSWHEMIDGKRVVFYNTSIATILTDGERYLRKLRNVFDIFRNNKDVVLWWRPHPLSMTTYKSMRQHLLGEYEQIVSEYKHGGWGIYDDTPDLHRVIAWSDAYYGDNSSVTALYRTTGKPLMIQDSRVISTNGKMPLEFEFLCNDGDYFWFTELSCNSLFKMSKITLRAEHIATIPGEKLYKSRLYSSISTHGNKLYFVPFMGNEVFEYTPETGQFVTLQTHLTEEQKQRVGERTKFYKSIAVDKYVFFIPYHYPGIIVYDVENRTVSCYDAWISNVEKLRTSEGHIGYFVDYVLDGSRLILPCLCADAIVIFDTETMTSVIWKTSVNSHEQKYCSVCHTGDNFYFLLTDGNVVKRKMRSEDENITMICLLEENCTVESNMRRPYSKVRYLDEYVWVFPGIVSKARKIDIVTDEVSSAGVFDCESDPRWETNVYALAKTVGKCLYAMNSKTLCLIEYNSETRVTREKQIVITEDDVRRIRRNIRDVDFRHEDTGYIYECKLAPLEIMLDELSHSHTSICNEVSKVSGNAGNTILVYVKKAVM